MLYAKNEFGVKIRASPKARAFCPLCDRVVIAKCGEIKVWHWAHETIEDCDPWAEGETVWHLLWKESFPKDWQEVRIGRHRADICTPDGFVVELQASSISSSDIRERERFYKKMCWIFNLEECEERFDFRDEGSYVTFRWFYPRKTIAVAKKLVFFDFGGESLFRLKRFYPEPPSGGWGYWILRRRFIDWLIRHPSGAGIDLLKG